MTAARTPGGDPRLVRRYLAAQGRRPPRVRLSDAEDDDSDTGEAEGQDPRELAELMAEVLYGVFGDGALEAMGGDEDDEDDDSGEGDVQLSHDVSDEPRDASGQWTASGGNASVPDRPKVPRTREEFRHVAASLRRAVMRSTRGKVKDQCINAAYALKAVFPEAVIWSGMYGDDYHTVAKLGGKFIDVTADQFRGPKIVIRGELPGRAEGGRYWGFERNDDLPSGAEGTPIAREFRKLLAESPRLPPVQLSAVARKNRAKWDPLAHPRGPGGRFIPKGSAEAHTAALAKVKALKGKPATRENVDELAGHLAILKRDHLRAIARAHGLKPPGKLREHLVQILMERLPGPKPEVVEKESGEKHVRIESGGKAADYAVKPMEPGKGEQTALRLENQTSGEVYDVVKKDDGTVTCTCPGFKHRGKCKHVGAIKDLAERGALPEPEKKAAEQHVAEQEAKDAYKAPGEFADIPRAGANAVLMKGATPEEQSRREKLVERLDAYERSFMETYQKKPDTRESVAHHNALMDSGLTENGLKDARAFAGKKASWKPGVFFPTAEHEDKVPGGKADDIPLEDFPPDKVAQGAAVEREHTSDPEVAKEIARDHLAEDQGYYDRLKAVEGEKPGEVPLEESLPAVQPGFEHLADPDVMQAKANLDQATSNVLRARQTPGTDDDDAADAAADIAEDAYTRAVDAAKARAADIPLEGPSEPEAATVPLEGEESPTSPIDSTASSGTIPLEAATEPAGMKGEKTMEPLKRREGESGLDFLRRFAANPGAAEEWGDVAPALNSLAAGDIPEAEKILGVDPSTRDRMYPRDHVFKDVRRKYEEATAGRGRADRAAKARQLLAEAETTSNPATVEKAWRDLTDIFKTSALQRRALADDLGVAYSHPDMAEAELDRHFKKALAGAKARAAAARAVQRVQELYARPKDFGLTKRDLPKTPPPGAMLTTPDVQQARGGGFPGNKKGDVVMVHGQPHVVLAASAVSQIRDPEHGILGRRQHILTRPATADEAEATRAEDARKRWHKRSAPFDDYNIGGYQSDTQRAEAEEWLRRYKEDPVAAYRADKLFGGAR